MKRMKFLPLVLLFGVVLFSCEKDSTKEWQYKYGFTPQDVIGHFTYSGVSDAFEGLTESEYFHLCDDAIIDISSSGVNGLQFNIRCPKADFTRSYTGQHNAGDEDFLIQIKASQSTYADEVTAYVYTNKSGKIRLHGYARKAKYHPATDEYYWVNYYFDVIKN